MYEIGMNKSEVLMKRSRALDGIFFIHFCNLVTSGHRMTHVRTIKLPETKSKLATKVVTCQKLQMVRTKIRTRLGNDPSPPPSYSTQSQPCNRNTTAHFYVCVLTF